MCLEQVERIAMFEEENQATSRQFDLDLLKIGSECDQ
jgi:hypothetical protein